MNDWHFGTISVPRVGGGVISSEERPRVRVEKRAPDHLFEPAPWDALDCHACGKSESEHPLGRKL
jgi:hypothetical protein